MKTTFYKWFNRTFKGLSLATVAFVFQACYGAPRDFGMDRYIDGVVQSTDGTPIAGIKVTLNDSIQYTETDEYGRFYFYTPIRDKYSILFSDSINNSYQNKDTIVDTNTGEAYNLVITLDKK
ncbi:MAG: hypothetical protein E6767_19815 [Dysgonomonas sp.]|nr:hypothetical protein [Dysgonomonas sp.]